MLGRSLNVVGENKGLWFILSIKEKSVEDILETYVKIGILTTILKQQVSEEGLKTLLRRNTVPITPQSSVKKLTSNTSGTSEGEKCAENIFELSTGTPSLSHLVENSSGESFYGVDLKVPLSAGLILPEKGKAGSTFLQTSFLNSAIENSATDLRDEVNSFSACSSRSFFDDDFIETFNHESSHTLPKIDTDEPVSIANVEGSISATSVYYDAVQSLSDHNVNLAKTGSDEVSLQEKARRIVSGVFLNVVDNTRPGGRFGDFSCDEENFAQSEVNIENSKYSSLFATLRENPRSWLSRSQPNCPSHETDNRFHKETRTSESSPIYIPESSRYSQDMETKNAPVNGNLASRSEENAKKSEQCVNNVSKVEKLFVRNINFKTSQTKLWSFFSKFGDVKYANVIRDYRTKKSKGYGHVQFRSEEDAKKVLSIPQHDLFLDDRELVCSAAQSKSEINQLRRGERAKELMAGHNDRPPGSSSLSECQSVESANTSPVQDSDQELSITGENYFDTLTDDMLLQIFAYLNVRERIAYERVCKRWQGVLVRSWMSVKKISFEDTVRRFGGMSDMTFQKIMKRTRTVASLDVSHVSKMLSDRAATIIGLYCSNVTDLDISGLPIKSKSLRELADKCSKLQSIKLNNCYSVPEKGFWFLLHQCKNLKHIEIENNKKITGQCFHLLSPCIQSICLAECSMVADGAIQRMGDRSHCLTELHLDHCRELTNSAIETIGKKCRMLMKLHLRGNFPKIESDGLVWVGRLHQLEELYASENLAVADSTLHALSNGCPRLRILDLTSCHRSVTDAGLQDLCSCTNLEELSINYLHKVHDEGIKPIAMSCNLKRFEAKGCGGITDLSLTTLAEYCQLEFVDISGNTQLTIRSISCFAGALTSRETDQPLTMVVGGITIKEDQLPSQPLFKISQRNTCQKQLRQDVELYFDLDSEDSDCDDEFGDFGGYQVEDDLIVGDNWAVNDDIVQDLLENDDPLAMEEFEMS